MNMNMSKLQDSGEEESGMLQCTGLQKVRHDIVTEQQQQIYLKIKFRYTWNTLSHKVSSGYLKIRILN